MYIIIGTRSIIGNVSDVELFALIQTLAVEQFPTEEVCIAANFSHQTSTLTSRLQKLN